jgi:hypothetical protein
MSSDFKMRGFSKKDQLLIGKRKLSENELALTEFNFKLPRETRSNRFIGQLRYNKSFPLKI